MERIPGFLPGQMDHVAGGQKERGLEEPMGDQVKDGQCKGAQSTLHDHVAHLGHGGIAKGFFNVVLSQHHGGPQKGRKGANHKNNVQCIRAGAVQGGQAIQEKTSGIDNTRVH